MNKELQYFVFEQELLSELFGKRVELLNEIYNLLKGKE
jgi:hypothetical protein